MELLIEVFGVSCFGYLLAEGARPAQIVKELLRSERWPETIRELINCSMCLSFWIGLAWFRGDIATAAAAAVIAESISRWMKNNMNF